MVVVRRCRIRNRRTGKDGDMTEGDRKFFGMIFAIIVLSGLSQMSFLMGIVQVIFETVFETGGRLWP